MEGESVTTVVCEFALIDKKMKAIKRVQPAIDLGVCRSFLSEKTIVMGYNR